MGVVTLLSKAVIIIASITLGVAFLAYLSLRVKARNHLIVNDEETVTEELNNASVQYIRQSYYQQTEPEVPTLRAPEGNMNIKVNEEGLGWESKLQPTVSKHEFLKEKTEEPVILDESFRTEPQPQPLPNIGKTTVNPKQQDWNDFVEPGKKPEQESGAEKARPEPGFLDVTDEAGNSGTDILPETPLSHAQSVFMKTFGTYVTDEPAEASPPLSEEPYSSLKPRLFQLKKPKGIGDEGDGRVDGGSPEWK